MSFLQKKVVDRYVDMKVAAVDETAEEDVYADADYFVAVFAGGDLPCHSQVYLYRSDEVDKHR